MLMTGATYRQSIRDGREVWIDGERVRDVTRQPAFRPIVDVRARVYDMAHETATRDVMAFDDEAGVVTRHNAVHCGIAAQTPAGIDVQ